MENHHEDPKPTNKWVATPIIAAFCVIVLVVIFVQVKSGQFSKCCTSDMKDHKTEQHDGTHENKENTEHLTTTDTTAVVADTNAVSDEHEGHEHGH